MAAPKSPPARPPFRGSRPARASRSASRWRSQPRSQGGVYALKVCAKPPKDEADADGKDNCKALPSLSIPADPRPDPDPDPQPSPNPDPAPGPAPDTTPPGTQITAGPVDGSELADNDPSFSFASIPAGDGGFECKLDAAAFAACASPRAFLDLGEGSHTFSVRAKDAAGNVDQTPATRTWTIDTIPSLEQFILFEDCLYNQGQMIQIGTVALDLPAIGDTAVSLSSGMGGIATVPGTTTVQNGQFTAPVTATIVGPGTTNLLATLNTDSVQSSLLIRSVGDPLAIESLTLNPPSVSAGGAATATVRLDCVAVAGGTPVNLGASDMSITTPATLTVGEGTSSGIATVQTTSATQVGGHQISADLGGGPATNATLTVTP